MKQTQKTNTNLFQLLSLELKIYILSRLSRDQKLKVTFCNQELRSIIFKFVMKSITFIDMKPTDPLPSYLSLLSSINNIYYINCNFPLPINFTNITNLSLKNKGPHNVYYNNIFSIITNLNKLQTLYLNNTTKDSILTISKLTNIKVLTLKGNIIGNTSILSTLTNLKTLCISNNKLLEIRCDSFLFLTKLTQLTKLEVLETIITSQNAINNIANCTSIKTLVLTHDNNNIDYLPLSKLNHLTMLHFDYARCDYSIIDMVNNIIEKMLDLKSLIITGGIILNCPVFLLTNLEELELELNVEKDNLPFLPLSLRTLILDFQNNPDECLKLLSSLSRLSNIQDIEFYHSPQNIVEYITKLTKINTLKFDECELNKTDMKLLSTLKNLTHLDKSSCYFTFDLLKVISSNCKNLTFLGDINIQTIKELQYLSRLDKLDTIKVHCKDMAIIKQLQEKYTVIIRNGV